MSILSAIPIIGDIFKGTKDLISEAITDKDKKNEIQGKLNLLHAQTEKEILEMNHQQTMAQTDIAKFQAKSNDAYVRRARPTILWICAAGFAYTFLIHPLLLWAWVFLPVYFPELEGVKPPPNLSMSEMMPVLLGMLGLSGMRSYERRHGKA